MKKRSIFLLLFLPHCLFAQFEKGQVLTGLSFRLSSSHSKGDSYPGDLNSSVTYQPRIGYFFKDQSMIGFSPRYSGSYKESFRYSSSTKSKTFGAELFFRQYTPVIFENSGLQFFGEISIDGQWQRNSDSFDNSISSHRINCDLKPGISIPLARNLFLELTGRYRLFARSKVDTVVNYSSFNPGHSFLILGNLRLILDHEKFHDIDAYSNRKGWKSMSGSFFYNPSIKNLSVNLTQLKFLTERLQVGAGAGFGFWINEPSSSVFFNFGPTIRYNFPLTNRFGFISSLNVRLYSTFPISNSNALRQDILNVNPSFGIQYFLQKNLALQFTGLRPINWQKRHFTDNTTINSNVKWRVMQFGWNLVYFFKKR